jgi:hypothetical protein
VSILAGRTFAPRDAASFGSGNGELGWPEDFGGAVDDGLAAGMAGGVSRLVELTAPDGLASNAGAQMVELNRANSTTETTRV